MSDSAIRLERPGEEDAIDSLIDRAFAEVEHSDGRESAIVRGLRAAGALALSLVAVRDGRLVGHAAFSPVRIEGEGEGWFGLGPVGIHPAHQRHGVGSALIRQGIGQLRGGGARGILVLGEPGYYGRFGFAHDPRLTFPGPPPEYFQRIVFHGAPPHGPVRYAEAFY